MQEYVDWLKFYFSKECILPKGVESINYFEAGLIDSLGVIDLIESIEEEFNMKFSGDHFQDRRFPTINGLAEIINEIVGKE